MKARTQILTVIITLAIISCEAMAQAPTITVFRGLTFGMSLGNTTNTVAPTDPGAAAFEVQVPGYTMNQYAYASIQVSISLPYSLKSGKNSMNVSYSTNSGLWNTTNSFSGATYFSPSSGYYGTLTANTPFTLFIWIGGTAAPGSSTWQAAGDYTGTISVTVDISVSKPRQKYSVSQTIPVTATVIQGLTLTETGAIDFGQIVAGTTPPAFSAQSGSAPLITAAGNGGSNITVTYSASTSMNDAYGHSLTFTPDVYGSDVSTGQLGSATVPSQAVVTLSGSAGVTGYYYFWLGGSLGYVPPGQTPGSYTGTFTLSVSY